MHPLPDTEAAPDEPQRTPISSLIGRTITRIEDEGDGYVTFYSGGEKLFSAALNRLFAADDNFFGVDVSYEPLPITSAPGFDGRKVRAE